VADPDGVASGGEWTARVESIAVGASFGAF